MGERPEIDWEVIERQFRAGLLSIREIATIHHISDTAIRKRAKAQCWERDLTDKIQAEVRSKLVRAPSVRADAGRKPADETEKPAIKRPTERSIIEDAANLKVEAVIVMRGRNRRAGDILDRLFDMLEESSEHRSEIDAEVIAETADDETAVRRAMMRRATSLPGLASTMKDLTISLKNLQDLDRKAYQLDEKGALAPREIDDARLREDRSKFLSILADMAKPVNAEQAAPPPRSRPALVINQDGSPA